MSCELKPWRLEDAEPLAAMLNNRKILDNLRDGLPYPCTKADGESLIQAMQPEKAPFAFAVWAEGRLCGSVAVTRQSNIHSRTAELGYCIAEPFWGKGIGTEAVACVCRYVFEHSDILRIFAEPFAYNTASCRVLEKNGFRYEGTMRSNAVKNDRVLDMRLYALVREM